MRLRTCSTTFLLLACFAPAIAHADVVTLESGSVLQGEITRKADGLVVLRLDSGATLALDPSQIARIDREESVPGTLAAREASLPPRDDSALAELGDWCSEQKLASEASEFYWRALEVNPNNSIARERLGFERFERVWLRGADLEFARGRVFQDGAWLPLADLAAVQASSAAGAEQLREAHELLGKLASAGSQEGHEACAAAYAALPSTTRLLAALDALKSPRWRERLEAVRVIEASGERNHLPRLVHAAVTDEKRQVRDAALRTIKSWGDPDTSLSFMPYLRSGNKETLANAANALSVFPDRRAVPELVEVAQAVWGGFGRAFVAQLVQRAYVEDYELVSGGTGEVVEEVADPVVSTFMEGVVLDVQIQRVLAESAAIGRALQRSTGRSFGLDFGRWKDWWAKEAGKKLVASR